MKFKQLLLIVAVSATSAVGSVWVYGKLNPRTEGYSVAASDAKLPVNYAGYFDNVSNGAEPVDFTKAASATVPAVVHIKTKIPAKKVSNNLPRNRNFDDFFDQFFGSRPITRAL